MMVMSSRAQRVGVAEAKARFAEVVGDVDKHRTIIQRRGKDVAVVIGIEDLARLEEASRGSSAGARLLARLDRVKVAAGVPLDLEVERVDLAPRNPFSLGRRRAPKKKSRS